ATVTLTNEATRVSFTTTTTSTGAYVFDSVQVGTYTVTVEKQGFKKSISPGNHLAIGEPLTVNVTLEVGQVAETVEVRAGAELVQTSTSGNFGTLVEQRLVERLPIVGTRGRNPLSLLELVPGVVSGSHSGGGIHINGARDRAWNCTQDCIDSNQTSGGRPNLQPAKQQPHTLAKSAVRTTTP